MRKINIIEPKVPQMPSRKMVAAYARVSMESERLQHSLSAQVSYYSSLIQQNPAWEYAGVYADDGITGTKTNDRTEFNRMIADCEAGKIDIILTKSISRFARNTVDLLNAVRHLKDLGISVQFEKEHIDSLSEDGELMLTLLASFAQEEVRSLSDNVKWGTRKRFEKGIPNGRFQIYGYRWDGDHLVVEPEEAKIVKLIYDNFLNGLSAESTEKQLEEMGVKSYKGQHFTSRIRCDQCGENYRRQRSRHKDGSFDSVWRCASSAKCSSPSIKEETLMALCAKAMGLDEFEETAFREQIACIHITAPFHLSIHFFDGHTFEAQWENKRKMPKHSEERKQHMREVMIQKWRERHGESNDHSGDDQPVYGSAD